MSLPLVSVLITVYSREEYLSAAIENVLAQTFWDFELIVMDDCSKDDSVEIARRYENDPRVRVQVNEQNLGDYPHRMRADNLARGRYLKYVDSDDLIYRHSLAIMVEAMEAHQDAALGLSHSAPEAEAPYPWRLMPHQAWSKQFLGRGCLSCGPSGAIVRRGPFLEIGGFRDWGVLSDVDLWYRMAARWPVVLLPPGLVWWRRHEQQEFTKSNAAMTYLERGFALTVDTLSSTDCPLPESERQKAIYRAKQHYARRLLSLGFRGRQPFRAWRLFRESGIGLVSLVRGIRQYE